MDARHLPLSVWPAAADTETVSTCRSGCCVPVSGPLARHLITACTRLGDLVIDLDAADHHVISTALAMGCQAAATITDPVRARVIGRALAISHPEHDLEVADLRFTRPDTLLTGIRDLIGAAALVVLTYACPSRRNELAETSDTAAQPAQSADTRGHEPLDLAGSAALLKPGGHLVVVTGLHRGEQNLTDPGPALIAETQRVGLLYLQHIVALRTPINGQQMEPPLTWGVSRAGAAVPGVPVSARVHSDVFIFTKPRTEDAGVRGHHPMLGDQAWLEGEQA
ncbi:hypothetical protein ACBJ59_57590 [Nonomuraea sp. MTCD27]|uniref:hypothetical protein n=1 Tax=Nonomuraea sp. MTCD27 TaxID=1676747 RepID=UPI0035BF8174